MSSKKVIEFATKEELAAYNEAQEIVGKAIEVKALSINEQCALIHRATSDFKEMFNSSLLTYRSGDIISDPYIIRVLLERNAPIAVADGANYTTCPCPCKHTFAVR